jgi:hypothetical protein
MDLHSCTTWRTLVAVTSLIWLIDAQVLLAAIFNRPIGGAWGEEIVVLLTMVGCTGVLLVAMLALVCPAVAAFQLGWRAGYDSRDAEDRGAPLHNVSLLGPPQRGPQGRANH